MKPYFEGWYFKHQNRDQTVSLIPGISNHSAFIQVITDQQSYHFDYDPSLFKVSKKRDKIKVGQSLFTLKGLSLHISQEETEITGELRYQRLTPLKSDIMGPFQYFPMECRHGVLSLHHRLKGFIQINGVKTLFDGGRGYIEKDSGRSFPKSYAWLQSNDFEGRMSIMASIAHIPFIGLHFQGLICVVWHRGVEYRLATYNGARVIYASPRKIVVARGPYRLEADIYGDQGHQLFAPVLGKMTRTLKENPSCPARFRFYKGNTLLFDQKSPKASFEYVDMD